MGLKAMDPRALPNVRQRGSKLSGPPHPFSRADAAPPEQGVHVLTGLTRVRPFSQDDGRVFVMESRIGDEVERLLGLVQRVRDDFAWNIQ